tara:strand:- start:2296 stop:2742 length:447 start_codon:yes stop_codon:yes gene_type:complete
MIKANVILDNSKWEKKIKSPKTYFKKKLLKLSKKPFFKRKNEEFSILLTNNKKMKDLNFKFRKKNKPTDVLSFPLKSKTKGNNYIGDIAISYEIINKRSKITGFELELDKIWIHGYFHLKGYDHKKNFDYKKMLRKEELVLKYFHQIN